MTQRKRKLISVLEQYPERFSYPDEHFTGSSPSAEELKLQVAQIEDIAFDVAPVDPSVIMAERRTEDNERRFPQLTLLIED